MRNTSLMKTVDRKNIGPGVNGFLREILAFRYLCEHKRYQGWSIRLSEAYEDAMGIDIIVVSPNGHEAHVFQVKGLDDMNRAPKEKYKTLVDSYKRATILFVDEYSQEVYEREMQDVPKYIIRPYNNGAALFEILDRETGEVLERVSGHDGKSAEWTARMKCDELNKLTKAYEEKEVL